MSNIFNGGTPKSPNLVGFSIINHPFWGTPLVGNLHMYTLNNVLVVGSFPDLRMLDLPNLFHHILK